MFSITIWLIGIKYMTIALHSLSHNQSGEQERW